MSQRLGFTVKELTGKKNIDRMDQMKKDIDKAVQQ